MTSGFPGRGRRRWLNPSVQLNIVAPIVAYWVLSRHGVSIVDALAFSAFFPAAGAVLVMVRSRKLDPVASLSLAAIVVSLMAGLAFHNGRFLLVKESLITGTLGVAFLGSLLTPKPLIVALRGRLSGSGQPNARVPDDLTSQSAAQRAEAGRTTAIWGVALLAEAATRVGLSYLLSAAAMVTISPFLALLILGPVALWTLRPWERRQTESDPSVSKSLIR